MTAKRSNGPVGKALLIVPCNGFVTAELNNIRQVLEEDRVEVFTAATVSPCNSLEGLQIQPDYLVGSINTREWDALIFLHSHMPEGYADNPALVELGREAWGVDRIIASIGTGTLVMANTGLLDDYRVAAGEEQREFLESKGAIITPAMALRDSKLITGRGPESTDMFAHLVSGAMQGIEK